MPPKTRASNRHVAEIATPAQASSVKTSPPALEYADHLNESVTSATTNNVDSMDTDEILALLPPAEIDDDTPAAPGSPDWEIDSHSYLNRCTLDGAYPKLLSALETWKKDPTIAGRVAAFMEYGADMKCFPATFGKHLMYRKMRDTPLHIVFFGEVAEPNFGTALGARGNHYIGSAGNVGVHTCCIQKSDLPERNIINDRSKIWNIITIRPPTDAPDELTEMYKDQVSLLNIVVEEDEQARIEKEEPVSVLS